jgi:hypothetical protein
MADLDRKLIAIYGSQEFPLVRVTRAEFDRLKPPDLVGMPCCWCPDEGDLVVVWPLPAPGWEVRDAVQIRNRAQIP